LVLGARARLTRPVLEPEIAATSPKSGISLSERAKAGWRLRGIASSEKDFMSLFDLVFGCWHKRRSFPITVRGRLRRSTAAAALTGTYVVCLDCGREFSCDWLQMKILAPKSYTAGAAEPVTIVPGLKAA
jgi:hypothetical protein